LQRYQSTQCLCKNDSLTHKDHLWNARLNTEYSNLTAGWRLLAADSQILSLKESADERLVPNTGSFASPTSVTTNCDAVIKHEDFGVGYANIKKGYVQAAKSKDTLSNVFFNLQR